MIKIIIKKHNIAGWVELPLTTSALNSIQSEQFLNKNEMMKFTIHEIALNEKPLWRFLKECTEENLYREKLNPHLKKLIRWINDSFGLLLSQNKNIDATEVCRGIWYKLHNTKRSTSPVSVTSKSLNLG